MKVKLKMQEWRRGDYVYTRLYFVLPKELRGARAVIVELPNSHKLSLPVRRVGGVERVYLPHEYKLLFQPGEEVEVWT